MRPASPAIPGSGHLPPPDGLEILVPAARIADAVDRLAADLSGRYGGREITLVAVLDGALIFAADLLRRLPVRTRLATMRASSYRDGATRPGPLRLSPDAPDLAGRHVVVVDDIVDSGRTLARIRREIQALEPASLRACVLLDKPDRREVPVTVEWVGMAIPDRFVVGYGLDHDGRYRSLPYIAALPGGQGS